MLIKALHHVQLAMPAGKEDDARRFYGEILGLEEEPKPTSLAGRGGIWFRLGEVRVHLGVETPFRPARKAHPALLVDDLDQIGQRFKAAGYEISADDLLPGFKRFYVDDPFGNRIEILMKRDKG